MKAGTLLASLSVLLRCWACNSEDPRSVAPANKLGPNDHSLASPMPNHGGVHYYNGPPRPLPDGERYGGHAGFPFPGVPFPIAIAVPIAHVPIPAQPGILPHYRPGLDPPFPGLPPPYLPPPRGKNDGGGRLRGDSGKKSGDYDYRDNDGNSGVSTGGRSTILPPPPHYPGVQFPIPIVVPIAHVPIPVHPGNLPHNPPGLHPPFPGYRGGPIPGYYPPPPLYPRPPHVPPPREKKGGGGDKKSGSGRKGGDDDGNSGVSTGRQNPIAPSPPDDGDNDEDSDDGNSGVSTGRQNPIPPSPPDDGDNDEDSDDGNSGVSTGRQNPIPPPPPNSGDKDKDSDDGNSGLDTGRESPKRPPPPVSPPPPPSPPDSVNDESSGMNSKCDDNTRPANYLEMRQQIFVAQYYICVAAQYNDGLEDYLKDFFEKVILPAFIAQAVDCSYTREYEIVEVLMDRDQLGYLVGQTSRDDGYLCFDWVNVYLQVNYVTRIGGSRRGLTLQGATRISPSETRLEDGTSTYMENAAEESQGKLNRGENAALDFVGFVNQERTSTTRTSTNEDTRGVPTRGGQADSLSSGSTEFMTSSTSPNFLAIFMVVLACLFLLAVALLAARRRMKKRPKTDAMEAQNRQLSLQPPLSDDTEADEFYPDEVVEEVQSSYEDEVEGIALADDASTHVSDIKEIPPLTPPSTPPSTPDIDNATTKSDATPELKTFYCCT